MKLELCDWESNCLENLQIKNYLINIRYIYSKYGNIFFMSLKYYLWKEKNNRENIN